MKKIMFNDHYGLTQAVLDGRKTQTRKIAYISQHEADVLTGKIPTCSKQHIADCMHKARYEVGEVVAVAQSYSETGIGPFPFCEAGWRNKMFVRADLMPHQIRITDVRVGRLQDISYEGCLAEGVYILDEDPMNPQAYIYAFPNSPEVYYHPREAYAALIDRISGKGTWESNPYVFVYEFELVK